MSGEGDPVVQAKGAGDLEVDSGIVWIQEHLGLKSALLGPADRLDLRMNGGNAQGGP